MVALERSLVKDNVPWHSALFAIAQSELTKLKCGGKTVLGWASSLIASRSKHNISETIMLQPLLCYSTYPTTALASKRIV